MSHNQKVDAIRAKLERWKSHNEVHAKPADGVLYDMLKDLLDLFTMPEIEDEDDEQPPIEEISGGDLQDEPQPLSTTEGGEGGNSPDEPPILP